VFLIRFSINNPLVTNLLLVFVVFAGLSSWSLMPQEMFPSIQLDMVNIHTQYDGAPPEDVEKQITLAIEERFDELADIDFISSSSAESSSNVFIKLKSGTNVDDFMRIARSELDQVKDLPLEAEKPELTRIVARFPVISIAIFGKVSNAYLGEIADQVRNRIQEEVDGVASVSLAGKQDWELWVVVNPEVLAAHKISLNKIAIALRENLKDLPGGSIKAKEGDILLRGRGKRPDAENIRKIVLRHTLAGGQLILADVAKIKYRLEEPKTLGRFNQARSVNLTISKTSQASTIKVANDIRLLVKSLKKDLPVNIKADVFADMSIYVKTRLNTVKSSGFIGLTLLLISLYIFLNFRIALITAMGIPVSFLVAVITLFYFGYTINMVTLFAFLIALGMIVDDAIIVNENIYRYLEEGLPPKEAAFKGASEVFWPVVASTITTIAAFLPMFAISGHIGAFIMVIPVVVTATLLGSLVEAFGVLPSHAAEMLRIETKRKRKQFVNWSAGLKRYLKSLEWSIHNRYIVVAITVGVLAVTAVYAKTRVPFNLFPRVNIGQFFVNVETPNTNSLQDSEALAKKIEKRIVSALGKDELKILLTNIGFSMIDFNRYKVGSRYIQFIVDLKKREPQGFIESAISPLVSLNFSERGERVRSNQAIIDSVRLVLKGMPGIERMNISQPAGGPAGPDLHVGFSGPDSSKLKEFGEKLVSFLKKQDGVHDIRHDSDPGKRELQYSINARGKELGLSQKQISDIVRTGFLGLEVVYVNRDEKRIPVRLIFNERIRKNSDLKNLKLTLANGKTVYLGDVAEFIEGRGMSTIIRRDLSRMISVNAEVDTKIITPNELVPLIQKEMAKDMERNPGYKMLFLGEKKNAEESFAGMRKAMLLALIIIYFTLSSLFKSLLEPLVVMCAIPFGLIGVVIGHVIFGYNLQFLSMIGFIALSGIVVNDSLILVDFVKKQRQKGMDRMSAVLDAGRVRIRPILLTTITTFLGVSPLIFFATGQTAFLSPMAVSLGFGLLMATVLILIVIPCFYLIADDIRNLTKKGWDKVFKPKDSISNSI